MEITEFIVHINSVGGDVYDGYAIGNIIKSLGKPTTASIGALCASISTYIDMLLRSGSDGSRRGLYDPLANRDATG